MQRKHVKSAMYGLVNEEYKAWLVFYRSVSSDPLLAAEVMAQLEADPAMKRQHLALYLSCKRSMRLHKARQKRNQRVGEFVRRLCHALFVAPLRAIRSLFAQGGDMALECLPVEPNAPRIAARPASHKTPGATEASPVEEVIPGSITDAPRPSRRATRSKPDSLQ